METEMEMSQKNEDEANRLLFERQKDALDKYLENLAVGTLDIKDFLEKVEAFQRSYQTLEDNLARIFESEGIVDDGEGRLVLAESFSGNSNESASCDSSEERASEAIGEQSLSLEIIGGGESDSGNSTDQSEEDLSGSTVGSEEK